MAAVNVRCPQKMDPDDLEVRRFDGRSFQRVRCDIGAKQAHYRVRARSAHGG